MLALLVGRLFIEKPIKVFYPGVLVLLTLGEEEQVEPVVYFLSTEPMNDDSILPALDIDGQVVLALYSIELVEWHGCAHSLEVEAVFSGALARPLWALVCWKWSSP